MRKRFFQGSLAPLVLAGALLLLDLALASGRLRISVTYAGMTRDGERYTCDVPGECLRMLADVMPAQPGLDPYSAGQIAWQFGQ